MSPHPLSPRRKRKRAPPSHSPPSAASPSRRAVGGELAKFRAVLAKNWTLKTRGASFFCFLLELLVPIAFVGLMCLPRALISDESHGVAFHRPNPIQSLAWSGVAPGGGSGAYKVVYAPNVTRYHRATAEAAAIDLVCGPPFAVDEGEGGGGSGGGSGAFVPSFMQQVALAAAVEVDAAALTNEFSIGGGGGESAGSPLDAAFATCQRDPSSCVDAAAGFLKPRENGLPLDSPLLFPPALLRATLCSVGCVNAPSCYRPVIETFLVGAVDETEAIRIASAAASSDADPGVLGVVILPNDLSPISRDITYSVRVNATDVPTGDEGARWASEKFERWVVGESAKWKKYYAFANLQRSFDQSLMRVSLVDASTTGAAEDIAVGALPPVSLLTAVKAFPFPEYSTNLGSTFAAVFFGLVFVFTFVTTVITTVKGIVVEKELRIREGMKIMGLGDVVYWSSWSVTSYGGLLVVSALVALVGVYPFQHTDWTVTFAFLALWTAQLVTFSFTLSAFFSSGKIAAIASALLYVLTWVPGVAAVASAPNGTTSWLLSCVMMPASGIYMWGWAVSILENAQEGVRWDNIHVNLLDGDEYTGEKSGVFGTGLIMLATLLNFVLYGVLAMYLDKVVPGSYGRAESLLFFAKPSYWRRRRGATPRATDAATIADDAEPDAATLPGGVEPESNASSSVPVAIKAVNLRKMFGSTVAIDGLRFTARAGQITSLLGHNGAGKTTTISVFTGMIAQDAGDAFVNGLNVATDVRSIRGDLGVCPQFDVLWPTLTVREHLVLYARIRGVRAREIPGEVSAKIDAVGLTPKADAQAGTLSGGQKRKLSVAIAFIGNPSVVILDEPTSGMDPKSRRATWEVIQGFKRIRGTSILLTTHFMDEADVLSDRVAIMSSGKLACVGSPLFLKTKFGTGYTLTASLKPDANVDEVAKLVTDGVKGARFLSRSNAAATFALPARERGSFAKMLSSLENKRDALRVDTVGVSCSTLEEVFLNVAELHDATDDAGEGSGRESRVASPALAPAPSATSSPSSALAPPPRAVENPESSSSVASTPPLVHGLALTCAQYRAVLVKRLTHARRDKLSHVTMYLVPLLFVVLGLVVSKISADAARDPPPAVMNDASFVGDLPLAFATAAGASVAKRILASASNARTLRAFEENEIAEIETVNATWHCWNASAVLDSCEPAVEACDQCTPLDDAGATLDGFLLENSVSARSSCVGGAHAFPTCAGLFAGAATGTLRLSESSRVFNYTIAVSSTAFHALPSTMASAHDAFFAALHATNASGVAAASMTTINHPLPTTPEKKAEQAMLMQLIVSLCVIMGLACLSASVAVFLVWERASASKHLQTVSGLHRGVFWAGTYTWDLLACFPPILLIFLAFAASGLDAYDGDALAVIAVALVLFITSAIPLAYIFHWPFENNMAALAAQMGTYFFFGVAQLIAGVVLAGLAAAGVATATRVWAALEVIFRWLPHYCVGRALFTLSGESIAPGSEPGAAAKSPWSDDVAGGELKAMACATVVYGALVVAIEYGAFRGSAWRGAVGRARELLHGGRAAAPPEQYDDDDDDDPDEDEGVRAERRVALAPDAPRTHSLTTRRLEKRYPKRGGGHVRAVNGVSFAVREGECFGLLGVNGAGKTSTFKMLSGHFPPSAGDAIVTPRPSQSVAASSPAAAAAAAAAPPSESFSILTQLARVRQHVGYCPQYDALQGTMTAREHLAFFGTLRGLSRAAANDAASALIRRLGLEKYADVPAAGYSGGTKRKLSVAIALVGDPAVVLLDEPSTGMDPKSRRRLWRALATASRGRCLVLTSHSMEECEALCARVGIMVAGKMRCLGDVQALKSAYGEGYTLDLRVPNVADVARVRRHVEREIPGARETEAHASRVRYRLPSMALARGGKASVAGAFASLEGTKTRLGIEDYQLGQTTLEEVFLRFAEEAADADDD